MSELWSLLTWKKISFLLLYFIWCHLNLYSLTRFATIGLIIIVLKGVSQVYWVSHLLPLEGVHVKAHLNIHGKNYYPRSRSYILHGVDLDPLTRFSSSLSLLYLISYIDLDPLTRFSFSLLYLISYILHDVDLDSLTLFVTMDLVRHTRT